MLAKFWCLTALLTAKVGCRRLDRTDYRFIYCNLLVKESFDIKKGLRRYGIEFTDLRAPGKTFGKF